jgi:hypothetical protein
VIVSIGDRRDDIDRLVRALEALARRAYGPAFVPEILPVPPIQDTRLVCSPRDAYFGPHSHVALSQAAGRISCDIVTVYPPGIPILAPGEEISRAAVDYLQFLGRHGARIDGVIELPEPGIRVLSS